MSARHFLHRMGALVLCLGMAMGARAAATDISSSPLITAAGSGVLPNLMFVLDDSGSMDWDYMPDHSNDAYCRSAGATYNNSGSFGRACCQNSNGSGSGSSSCWVGAAPFGTWRGHPPFLSSDFNGVYYNPAVTYRPPLNADGTSLTPQTSANTSGWGSVRNDAYQKQNTGTINLLTQFPDTEWCTDSYYTDCLRNDNYVLPGRVGGKDYTVFHATTAQGSGQVATGAPDNATTASRSFGPHYYAITAGEFCKEDNLRDCQAAQTSTYSIPAPIRWCNSDANARASSPAVGACQAVKTSTYSQLRYPTKYFSAGTAGAVETAASSSFTISLSGCDSSNKISITKVLVNSVDLLGGLATNSVRRSSDLAIGIADGINNQTASTKYSATVSGSSVTILAPVSAGAITYSVSFTRTGSARCTMTTNPATPKFSGYVAASPSTAAGFPGSFRRVDIVPGTTSYPKAASRVDCAGASCTYAEEMTNFANWWTYYHSRMQTMKSSAATAFSGVSNQFRVGYTSINNATGTDFLNVDVFENTTTSTQKSDWFSKLRAARPSGSTPLRTALSTVGRFYAGQLNGSSFHGATVTDPMQYSCQQNFTLLSTDGFWNETSTPKQINGSTDIGDQDSSLERPMLDGTATSNALADVAAYYYFTDLRDAALSNCSGATGEDVCENNVKVTASDVARTQHMTTFTLGLGASGYMQFRSDYQSATSGDYFAVKNGSPANPSNGVCSWQTSGTCNWPTPVGDTLTAIDDLWHAAVNGHGSYFSARDPATLYTGLSTALAQIDTMRGAAAAATTSNPNVATGDNFVFISKYVSGEWSGELLGQHINTETGAVETSGSDWSARTLLDAKTSRTIYTFSSAAADGLRSLSWDNLDATEQAYFQKPHITASGRALSQFCALGATCLPSATQDAAAGQPLLQFVLGDRSNEGGAADTSKYFRQRSHVLGDIVNSEAVYVKKAMFNYADAGYGAYKTSSETRQGMVYVGANDGMLHAFNSDTGDEAWAFVPTMVLPTLYKLADKEYASRHAYYVDGTPAQGDVYFGGAWHTILVGGLGAGGRGYYALDVTDPTSPKALWEFNDSNMGLGFGRPEIAKLRDGTWVVMLSSGYNNVSPGDGHGRLYVLNAATGAVIRSIDTGVGGTGTPSGLVGIRAWVDNADTDNTAARVYAGDNLGNVWRFDVNNEVGAAGYDAQLLATLRNGAGDIQPITARPEIGAVVSSTGEIAMVYVGTGRYLGVNDLTDHSRQTIYAIKDMLTDTGHGNPRGTSSGFVEQVLTATTCPGNSTICSSGQSVRTGTNNAVDLTAGNGWYVDLPLAGERANTDPQLVLGTLVFTTNVVSSTACTVGGSSYLNFFDYRTGAPVSTANGVSSVFLGNAIATRPTVVKLPNGKVVSLTRLSDDTTAINEVPIGMPPSATRRVLWRELNTEQ